MQPSIEILILISEIETNELQRDVPSSNVIPEQVKSGSRNKKVSGEI